MNLGGAQTRRRSVIGLTPLIDVVFILLLFFMLASNFSTERSVSVASQSESGAATTGDTEIVNVQVLAANQYVIAGNAYNSDSLLNFLLRQRRDFTDVAISIGLAPGVAVQSMMDLISLAKQSGIENVSMSRGSLP